MKHTKGPWEVIRNQDKAELFRPFYIMADTYIAEVSDPVAPASLSWGEVTANARLIAAAPDLLANLENLLAAIEAGITTETMLECAWNENSYIAQAKEAIQKAKGD